MPRSARVGGVDPHANANANADEGAGVGSPVVDRWDEVVAARFAPVDDVYDQVLAEVDSWCAEEALEYVIRANRQAARVQELVLRAQVRFASLSPPYEHEGGGDFSRYAGDEIAAALRQSSRTARSRLDEFWAVAHLVPKAVEALSTGDLDWTRVRGLAEVTEQLAPDQRARVEKQMVEGGSRPSPSAFRRRANDLVQRLDPEAAVRRREQRYREREVEFRPGEDGMAQLLATLAAQDARAIFDRIDLIARTDARVPGGAEAEDRPLAARRADVLTGLLLGNRREHVNVTIQVVVSAGSLLGLADEPAELAGYGPIPAQLARDLAADATWRRILTDPVSGALLDVGDRRFPPPALARLVRARNTRCTFPGCAQPASSCELDHTIAVADGGRTVEANLGPACTHHHRMKHQGGWTLTQPEPGMFDWTSPHLRTYRTTGNDDNPVVTRATSAASAGNARVDGTAERRNENSAIGPRPGTAESAHRAGGRSVSRGSGGGPGISRGSGGGSANGVRGAGGPGQGDGTGSDRH
jgi:hypothetical protein